MTGGQVIRLPGVKEVPKTKKAFKHRLDTAILTPAGVRAWKDPPFQRPLKVNQKVIDLSEAMKEPGAVMPGIITLGEVGKETYLLDGQHRREAFLMSGVPEIYADLRIMTFEDFADMGEEFVELNSRLVTLKPDDILRGLEGTLPPMMEIRRRCPFITYGQVHRAGQNPPVMAMSAALRAWTNGAPDVPARNVGNVVEVARRLTDEEATRMVEFFNRMRGAWGTEPEVAKLWSIINVTICSWLWRRIVLEKAAHNKSVQVTAVQFAEAAMGLSADSQYMPWLIGRQMGERDRGPCYNRVKKIFVERLERILGRRVQLPAPPWAGHHGR